MSEIDRQKFGDGIDEAALRQCLQALCTVQAATPEWPALIASILDYTISSVPCERAVLFTIDTSGTMLSCAGVRGLNDVETAHVMPLCFPVLGNTSQLHPIIAQRQIAYVSEAMLQANPSRSPAMQRLVTVPFWVFPLHDADRLWGVLLIDNGLSRTPITPNAVATLDGVRPVFARAIAQSIRYHDAVQAAQDVEHQVSLRTLELTRALGKKDEYLANMSHELRTPLTSIMSMAQSMQMGLFGPLPESQRSSIDIIEDSSRHLLSLINSLLDLAKIESGKMELLLEQVDIADCCHHVQHLLSHAIREKHLRLSVRIEEHLQFIDADETRLIQMLVNLLNNAVKFTPEHGEIGIEVTGDPAAMIVKVAVWDTGIGIASEQVPLVFEPFVQLDAPRSLHRTGTGLGLSLVRRITELHGGSVSVTSTPGEGSRFEICLPWLTASTGDSQAQETLPTTDLSGDIPETATVLVADDQVVVRESISRFLAMLGYRVETATNGVETIERALAIAPDIILLDIQMPHQDGFSVTATLRQHQITANTPIIACTAMVLPGDRERCIDAGMNDYLAKPIDFRELRRVLRRYCAHETTTPSTSLDTPG